MSALFCSRAMTLMIRDERPLYEESGVVEFASQAPSTYIRDLSSTSISQEIPAVEEDDGLFAFTFARSSDVVWTEGWSMVESAKTGGFNQWAYIFRKDKVLPSDEGEDFVLSSAVSNRMACVLVVIRATEKKVLVKEQQTLVNNDPNVQILTPPHLVAEEDGELVLGLASTPVESTGVIDCPSGWSYLPAGSCGRLGVAWVALNSGESSDKEGRNYWVFTDDYQGCCAITLRLGCGYQKGL